MTSLEENIQCWIVRETNGLIDGHFKKLPDIPTIRQLTEGRNKKVWTFISERVKSQQSIAHTRKILQLRQYQKQQREREKYQVSDDKDCVVLKQEVINAEEKVLFIENSNKKVIKHISSLKTSVKSKKEENCILNQKCTFLELAVVNCRNKNKNLNALICKLNFILSKLFASEKTKCFEKLKVWKSTEVTKQEVQMNNVNDILYKMVQIAESKMLDESKIFPIPVNSVIEFMNQTHTTDLVNLLKDASKQAYDSLKNKSVEDNSIDCVQQKSCELSKNYLLCLKQDHVDSCFNKKRLMKHELSFKAADELFLIIDMDSNLQKDYFSLYIQNKSLLQSNQYLEEQLLNELGRATIIKKSYTEQKLLCKDLQFTMQHFYKKLDTLHRLFNLAPQNLSEIQSILMSCKTFIDTELLCAIKSNNTECLMDGVNQINDDYKLSLELLRSKEFLKDFLQEFDLTKLNLPVMVNKVLDLLKPFKNRSLLINRLACLKNELSAETNIFNFEFDESFASELLQLISSFEGRLENLHEVEKVFYKVKDNVNLLKILLEDWWCQGAQFIPNINYEDKSLKMWLDIVYVLDNTE